jgi:hypothetical protein
MNKWTRLIVDNSLSLVMIVLFLCCLVGQAYAGALQNNHLRALHGQSPVRIWDFIATGTFLQAVFSNWQAAILQLGSLIIFGVYLRQRGAPHSRQLQSFRPKESSGNETQAGKRAESQSRRHSSRSGEAKKSQERRMRSPALAKSGTWLHRNSLSMTFVLLFLGVIVLHLISGAAAYNEQLAYLHQSQIPALQFFFSAQFWFATLQTWEAEYMAIALYILLSVHLRQEGSPESKPVEASDSETGHANK